MVRVVFNIRKVLALCILGGGLAVTIYDACPLVLEWLLGERPVHLLTYASTLPVIGVAFFSILTGAAWGRWAGLAVALLALWWSLGQAVYLLSLGYAPPLACVNIPYLLAGGLLLAALSGKLMYRHYDEKVFGALPQHTIHRARIHAVSLSAVVAITLLPFVMTAMMDRFAYWGLHGLAWVAGPALCLGAVGLVAGVALIARQKTAGVFLIALAGPVTAWAFSPMWLTCGTADFFEVACRAGHSLVYVVPALVLLPSAVRKLRQDRDPHNP